MAESWWCFNMGKRGGVFIVLGSGLSDFKVDLAEKENG